MKRFTAILILGCGMFLTPTSPLLAQPRAGHTSQNYYYPLDQTVPPGKAGRWAGALGRADMRYLQPVRIHLPGSGDVAFLQAPQHPKPRFAAPAQAGVLVGPVYRLKISNIEGYPGLELYPTLELIDRLHPPAHLKQKYPIPVELTEEDLEKASRDQLVTKIIYIEQPDLADPLMEQESIREEELPHNRNLIKEADLRGRPVLILRIGGRIPSPEELSDPHRYPPLPHEFVKP